MSVDFSLISAEELQDKIETTWNSAAQQPNVLRYELKVEKERQTTGEFGFLLQVDTKIIQKFLSQIITHHSFLPVKREPNHAPSPATKDHFIAS